MKGRMKLLQKFILMGILFSISIVFSQSPNWSVNSADYSLDASIIAVLKIDDQISTDTNDIIAVFDDNNVVRGVANVTFNSALNKYLVFISTHSNSNGDAFKFKVYDASENTILESTNSTLSFSPNEVLGSADTPFEVKANKVLGVDNYEKNSILFFPNPVKNKIKISSEKEMKSVKVYNTLGEEVMNINTQSNVLQMQLQSLIKGVYFIKIKTIKNTVITHKIVKI
jgi:hypothetical protein